MGHLKYEIKMWHLDDIAIFAMVAETGSFVRGAQRLGMPTSTVSRRISKLEESLGIQLLERTSRSLHLTRNGKLFFEGSQPHIKQLKENISAISSCHEELRGKIKVTAPTFLGSEILGPLFIAFSQEHPEIELDLQFSNQIESILENEIDIAIRVGPLEDSRFIAQYLFTSTYTVCASPDYLSRHPLINKPKDLEQHEIILVTHQPNTWIFQQTKSEIATTIELRGRIRANQIDFCRKAVLSGLGITILPTISIQPLIDSGELVNLFEKHTLLPQRDLYLLYPSKTYLAKKTQYLLNFLKNAAKNIDCNNYP